MESHQNHNLFFLLCLHFSTRFLSSVHFIITEGFYGFYYIHVHCTVEEYFYGIQLGKLVCFFNFISMQVISRNFFFVLFFALETSENFFRYANCYKSIDYCFFHFLFYYANGKHFEV